MLGKLGSAKQPSLLAWQGGFGFYVVPISRLTAVMCPQHSTAQHGTLQQEKCEAQHARRMAQHITAEDVQGSLHSTAQHSRAPGGCGPGSQQ